MTDPIQTTNPPQQHQQGSTDDILGGEDIFATIPSAPKTQEPPKEGVMAYDDIVEKKYEFEPIPESIEEVKMPTVQVAIPQENVPVAPNPTMPTQTENTAQVNIPVPQVAVSTPVAEVVSIAQAVTPSTVPLQQPAAQEEILPVVTQEEDNQQNIAPDMPKVEVSLATNFQTDVQKKFGELLFTTKKIYDLKNKIGITDETFDILGADNDKIFISYRFLLDETDEPTLFITKIEQDKDTEEETENELKFTFNEEASSLEVMINDTLLFDEIEDFTEDQKKKMQVVDKLNKFTFLASEEVRKLEKEIKEKEEAEQERKKLQEIFRNF